MSGIASDTTQASGTSLAADTTRPDKARPRSRRPGQRRRGNRVRQVAVFTLATVWLLIVLIPLYYMLLATFRTEGTYLTENPWLPTGHLSISSYTAVFGAGLGRYLLNSAIVTVVSVSLVLVLSLGAAFRVIRKATPASRNFMKLIVVGLAVPLQAIIVPVYLLVIRLGLYDTATGAGVILVLSAAAIPISVLVMVNFVRDIPTELYDAMGIDGASEWTIFRTLVWPLSLPVLSTVAIYDGLNVWNNFLVPLVLTSTPNHALLPLGLLHFQSAYAINVPAILAAVWLSMLPLLLLFLVLRKQVIGGLGGIALR